ncbi:hypothetical protein Patl1_30786 [Pistacia atlantica]|uniref:Uncharacterized protein n=1 Tax=Pistacia atlantica TaxID=434234 RepID=A0ACC1ADA0_9ROSI|nr:hypothetical protein Patl1_30786 [Pistacia atlantica]
MFKTHQGLNYIYISTHDHSINIGYRILKVIQG